MPDLDENKSVAVHHDQVDLALPARQVPGNQHQAALLQKAKGFVFGGVPHALGGGAFELWRRLLGVRPPDTGLALPPPPGSPLGDARRVELAVVGEGGGGGSIGF